MVPGRSARVAGEPRCRCGVGLFRRQFAFRTGLNSPVNATPSGRTYPAAPGECQLSVYGDSGPYPTQPAATEASALISRGPLRTVYDKNLDRTLLRVQFQSELFL